MTADASASIPTSKHKLPDEVTHLDLIKTFAVIVMIIDHIGYYFFPEQEWFRAIGRIGFPVWFFMVGYARGRELSNKLLIGALILLVANLALQLPLFPLNALVTIIFLRLLIDRFMDLILRTRYVFWLSAILLVLFYMFSNMITEYGTIAMMFAVAGYLTRHKDKVETQSFMTNVDYILFMVLCFSSFCVLQTAQFGFNEIQSIFMAVLTGATMFVLAVMRPMVFPEISHEPQKTILQFMGRRTLEIYVAHLLLFKVMMVLFHYIGFYS